MGRRWAKVTMGLAFPLLLLATIATSSTAAPLPPPGGFSLKASNGYSIFVFGAPARNGRPAGILISVTSKGGGTIYAAPATVTETSIQAELGALGEIAVTFHPSGVARTDRSECGGEPVSYDSGYYEGTIDFHGEQGFTTVESAWARGDIGFLLDLLCPALSGVSGGPFLPGAELDVKGRRSRLDPSLQAVKNRPAARAHFEVGISEESHGISIARFADIVAPADSFEYDPLLKTAIVRPPAPFSGTARFHRGAKPANRWTGNLTVDLPGRADVKLTGSRVRAKLAHARWIWEAAGRGGTKGG